jgi:hypothetical protein
MINQGQLKSEELRIQGLLDQYLKFRSSATAPAAHLDEDSLNAFVEGRLGERELSPVIKHLIDCSFCLNVTAELTKLEMAFAEEEIPAAAPATEPTRVSDVLKGLLARIFGTQDAGAAVFALEDKKEEEQTEEKKDE